MKLIRAVSTAILLVLIVALLAVGLAPVAGTDGGPAPAPAMTATTAAELGMPTGMALASAPAQVVMDASLVSPPAAVEMTAVGSWAVAEININALGTVTAVQRQAVLLVLGVTLAIISSCLYLLTFYSGQRKLAGDHRKAPQADGGTVFKEPLPSW